MKHARARARAHEVGKGNGRIMHPAGRSGRSGHPILASAALRLRAFDRNLICGEHYGQRPSKSTASTGRTHGSTDQLCITVKNPLPTGSRPHMAKSGSHGLWNLCLLYPQQETFGIDIRLYKPRRHETVACQEAGIEISLFRAKNSLFGSKNSLLCCLGNLAKKPESSVA